MATTSTPPGGGDQPEQPTSSSGRTSARERASAGLPPSGTSLVAVELLLAEARGEDTHDPETLRRCEEAARHHEAHDP